MKTWLLLLLLLSIADNSYGQFTKGDAQFTTTSNDSLAIVKEQLIYLATRDVISRGLTSLGFDNELFWQQYQAALQAELQPIEKNMREKYSKEGQETRGDNFRKAWRRRRLQVERRFGNLLQVLDSYKVGQIRHSERNPKVRYLSMEGKINRAKLERLYFRFARSSTVRNWDKIYWTFELNLSRGDWKQLGVENREQLSRALNESLIQKLQEVMGASVQNIVITGPMDFEQIQSHLKTHGQKLAELKERGEEDSRWLNSAWAHLKFDVGLHSEAPELGRKEIESRGDFVVTELQHNRPIYLSQIQYKKNFVLEKSEGPVESSMVGNKIYQRIIGEFVPLKAKMAKLPLEVQRTPISITGHRNYLELQELRELLIQAGGKYRLRTHLDFFSLGRAQIILEYIGQKNDLGKILVKMRGRSLKGDRIILMGKKDDLVELKIQKTAGA